MLLGGTTGIIHGERGGEREGREKGVGERNGYIREPDT